MVKSFLITALLIGALGVAVSSITFVPAFASEGTPGIAPGCPNPSGDNQCGEAPRQREIGQVNDQYNGYSREAQDPNGVSGDCYGNSIASTATLTTPNPKPVPICP